MPLTGGTASTSSRLCALTTRTPSPDELAPGTDDNDGEGMARGGEGTHCFAICASSSEQVSRPDWNGCAASLRHLCLEPTGIGSDAWSLPPSPSHEIHRFRLNVGWLRPILGPTFAEEFRRRGGSNSSAAPSPSISAKIVCYRRISFRCARRAPPAIERCPRGSAIPQ